MHEKQVGHHKKHFKGGFQELSLIGTRPMPLPSPTLTLPAFVPVYKYKSSLHHSYWRGFGQVTLPLSALVSLPIEGRY